MFYSKTTRGFYSADIHGDAIPADAVEITDEFHAQLLADQAQGATIQADADGQPVAVFPPPPTLDQLKAAKLAQLVTQAQAQADALTAGYPQFEMDTWPDQKAEATAWNRDNTAATPCLDALAKYRGIDRVAYIQKTLAKVTAFQAAGLYLAGTKQRLEDAIKAAADQAALDAIAVDFTLPGA